MSNNQLQNEEYYLPGDLGEVRICGQTGRPIETVIKRKDGSVTITIGAPVMTEKQIDATTVEYTIESPVTKQLKQ